ncbi:AAA family ATPase [Colletotrichum tofieldiae]|nr:AAA family ATPase [Colletotrichum tofieldiae]
MATPLASLARANEERASLQTHENLDQINQLEEEIQRLRGFQQALGSTTWIVLHQIEGEDSVYFAEPSWTGGQKRNFRLRGNAPLADEAGYLRQRRDLAFVVYKYYQHDAQSKAIEKAKSEGSMLPDPIPVSERVQILSDKMVSSLDTFLDAQPTFAEDLPDWSSRDPIMSPFLFWYHYRSDGCLDALEEPARSQMYLLSHWIEENYDHIYNEARDQFAKGYVSKTTMPFFIRPVKEFKDTSQNPGLTT